MSTGKLKTTIITSERFEAKQRRNVWKVMSWCSYLLPSGVFFVFFPSLTGLGSVICGKMEKTHPRSATFSMNVTFDCSREAKMVGCSRSVQMELCVNELQALFPLFSTQHNLSSCHDDMRTFRMQHRFQMSEQTDRNKA